MRALSIPDSRVEKSWGSSDSELFAGADELASCLVPFPPFLKSNDVFVKVLRGLRGCEGGGCGLFSEEGL